MSVPTDLQYTAEHEWLRFEDAIATVGITEFAAAALGDIVFAAPPPRGTVVLAGQICGEIESTKAVSDLYAPATGEVIAVNEAAVADPSLLNTDPFGAGWLFKIDVTSAPDLLDADAYTLLTGGGS